jgi:hypothetical protein
LYDVPRIGSFKISVAGFIAAVTLLDIFGLILILLAIQYAGSGLFEGKASASKDERQRTFDHDVACLGSRSRVLLCRCLVRCAVVDTVKDENICGKTDVPPVKTFAPGSAMLCFPLAQMQAFGIMLVIGGLVVGASLEILESGMCGLACLISPQPRAATQCSQCTVTASGFGQRSEMMYIGCILSLASAFVYAVSFVISEAAMCDPNAPDPKYVASRMGIAASCLCALYVVSGPAI